MNPCSRCPRRTTHRAPVYPTGPIPARVMLLGEQPAREEDYKGEPFRGRTGKELDATYLPLASLPRSEVYIMNARQCSTADYSNPEPIDADSCMSLHLGPTLAQVQPQVLVPMGAVACSLWPEINLNLDHGLPSIAKWGSWEGILFPSFHPAAGLRATGFMIPLMQDFKTLGDLLRRLPIEWHTAK